MEMRCKQGSCSSTCSWRGSPYALPTTGDSRTRQPAVMPLQTGLLHAERCTSGSCFHCEPARQLILYLDGIGVKVLVSVAQGTLLQAQLLPTVLVCTANTTY